MKYADYFVISSGTSTRHLHAMAHYLVKMVRLARFPLHHERGGTVAVSPTGACGLQKKAGSSTLA